MEVGAWLDKYLPNRPVFKSVARAISGTLMVDDREPLRRVVGFTAWPRRGGYHEAILLAGRRSGKSSGVAALALHEAIEVGPRHMAHLPPGTRGHVLIVSRTQRQASETFRYARAMAQQHFADQLEHVVENQSGGELHFLSGVVISVGVASASSLRGFTVLLGIVDEAAHLGGVDETSERDLEEILSTLRMAMLAPTGAPPRRLLIISSPGVKAGYLYEQVERCATDPRAPVLVARGASYVWNESLDRDQLERERQRDPRRYAREVEAEFVGAISPLLDDAAIDRAADRTPLRIEPDTDYSYCAAVDIGLRRDSTALAITHIEEREIGLPRVVVDGVWRWSPQPGQPLDVRAVVDAIVAIATRYGVRQVTADQFCFDSVRLLFADRGIELVEHTWSQQSKTQRFGLLRDLLVDNRISLPPSERLLSELRSLDEQILPSGTIRIAARGRQHDDCAFACCLAVSEAVLNPRARTAADWYADLEEEGDVYCGY